MNKLAIFDLDGTLLDTIDDLAAAVNHALSLRKLSLHSSEEYRLMVGHGIRNLMIRALTSSTGVAPDDYLVDDCLVDFKRYYMEHIDVFSKPYEGICELLDRLDADGWMMAVASNKFQAGTEHLVLSMFPEIPWIAVLGNREGKALKPDPAVVEEILSIAGTKSGKLVDNAYFIGDSGTDMKTARNAGLPGIAVTWGFRTREELKASGADCLVDTPEQLYALLTKY